MAAYGTLKQDFDARDDMKEIRDAEIARLLRGVGRATGRTCTQLV